MLLFQFYQSKGFSVSLITLGRNKCSEGAIGTQRAKDKLICISRIDLTDILAIIIAFLRITEFYDLGHIFA